MAEETPLDGQEMRPEQKQDPATSAADSTTTLIVKSYMNEGVVTLSIGTSETKFYVHKVLLIRESAFCRAALSEVSNFKEAQSQSIDLPTVDPEVFDLMMQWIYHRKVSLPALNVAFEKGSARYRNLVGLYELADQLQILGLKNFVIDSLYDFKGGSPTTRPWKVSNSTLKNVEEMPAMVCPGLRKLLVRWYVYRKSKAFFSEPETREFLLNNPNFAAYVAMELGEQQGVPKCPFDWEREAYYEQADENELEMGKMGKENL